MFNWLRKIVAGPKNRTVQDNYDLDLTYITPNIIAMAYPASGIQKTVRNCREDVASYLNQKHHQSYYIINVSGRSYCSDEFGGRVKEYDWNDHQAPCLTTLFQIIEFSNNLAKQDNRNVIAVHCNHGKGRTGTAIMCLLMYNQVCNTVRQVLDFYNAKRFSTQNYKVQQPCQLRYLQFFKEILQNPKPYRVLKTFRLKKISHSNLDQHYYVKIQELRSRRTVFQSLSLQNFQPNNSFMISDIFIQIKKKGILWDSRAARINFNLAFLEQVSSGSYAISFNAQALAVDACQKNNYLITFQFQLFCNCHQAIDTNCQCFKERIDEMKYWGKMYETIIDRSLRMQSQSFGVRASSDLALKL